MYTTNVPKITVSIHILWHVRDLRVFFVRVAERIVQVLSVIFPTLPSVTFIHEFIGCSKVRPLFVHNHLAPYRHREREKLIPAASDDHR